MERVKTEDEAKTIARLWGCLNFFLKLEFIPKKTGKIMQIYKIKKGYILLAEKCV